MAYRSGDRSQQTLLPPSVEDYVAFDAPVRAYDAMVEAMDLSAMGFFLDGSKVGNPQYDPKAMLKLLVYGYSYGIRSSRKLERECHYNLSFIWLTGGLKPDHKTIAEFRRKNKGALQQVIRQCARICIDLNLIDGNVLFIDGTRLRANAAIESSWTADKCNNRLAELDKRITTLLSDCEAADESESEQSSLVHLEEKLADSKALKARIEDVLGRLNTEKRTSLNTTDEDCVRIHSRQGSHAGYNAQIAVDDANGLIVNSDVAPENNDMKQFATQLEQANAVLDTPCKTACADAGYADYGTLSHVDRKETDVIVPPQLEILKEPSGPFDKWNFKYDADKDVYICPEGHELRYVGTETKNRCRSYYAGKVCWTCKHFGNCTKARSVQGRRIRRYEHEDLHAELEKRYAQADAKEIFARRKELVEHPFGHIKRNLNAGHFLLRGLAGVRAEMSLLAGCFDIRRMITMLGVQGLAARLEECCAG
jgi:transposase